MKKIKFYNNRFSFMEKPLLILSVLSIPIYALKLFDIENTDLIYTAVTVIIVLSALFLNVKNLKKVKIVLFILVLSAIFFIFCYDKIVLFLADYSKDSPLKFGIINTLFNTFGLNDYQNYIDFTGYGGSHLINNEIVSGAVNIFKNNPGSKIVSQFLTARFLLIFSLFGFAASMGRKNIIIIIIAVIAVITGNCAALLLALLFLVPVYYLLVLISSFACSFVSSAVGIKLGFFHSASVFELLVHNDNKIYALIICVFVFCLSYYLARLVEERVE